jgi:hypothetical protein
VGSRLGTHMFWTLALSAAITLLALSPAILPEGTRIEHLPAPLSGIEKVGRIVASEVAAPVILRIADADGEAIAEPQAAPGESAPGAEAGDVAGTLAEGSGLEPSRASGSPPRERRNLAPGGGSPPPPADEDDDKAKPKKDKPGKGKGGGDDRPKPGKWKSNEDDDADDDDPDEDDDRSQGSRGKSGGDHSKSKGGKARGGDHSKSQGGNRSAGEDGKNKGGKGNGGDDSKSKGGKTKGGDSKSKSGTGN